MGVLEMVWLPYTVSLLPFSASSRCSERKTQKRREVLKPHKPFLRRCLCWPSGVEGHGHNRQHGLCPCWSCTWPAGSCPGAGGKVRGRRGAQKPGDIHVGGRQWRARRFRSQKAQA